MSLGRQKYVVLRVIEGDSGIMDTYGPQVAMVHEYDSAEDAAVFNVGSHPAFDERLKRTPDNAAYRTVVVPWEHWLEFEVFSESVKGRREFKAYPTEHPTIRAHGEEAA